MNYEGKTTFFSKNKIACPVCGTAFLREDLLTGRGRLIAGDLTPELRRLYDPSEKYGGVCPLIYPVTVCPSCYYAAFSQDFLEVGENARKEIDEDADRRLHTAGLIFEELDFREPRTLKEGIASYYFAMMCYDYFPEEQCPTIKQGLSALRAAWLSNDMSRQEPEENYQTLAELFYRKARFFYLRALENEQDGTEAISNDLHLGPDLDKNYGYDGVLYLAAYLELLYGKRQDEAKRVAALKDARRTVARIFGMGKATKSKPEAILELSRELYERLGAELAPNESDGEP